MDQSHVIRTVRANYTFDTRGVEGNVAPSLFDPDADTEVVELELGDGLSLFTGSGGDLGDQVKLAIDARNGVPTLRLRSARIPRGISPGLVVKGLKVLGVDLENWLGVESLVSTAADRVAHLVADRVDHRDVAGRDQLGLYRCAPDRIYGRSMSGKAPSSDGPALVLLHGFMSSTSGSFGGLWDQTGKAYRDELLRAYGEAVYGFDHATLGGSPIDNAITLVNSLPDNTTLHLLSHSRGGLIGELLSRAQFNENGFSPREREWFRQERPSEADALEELIARMAGKRIAIDRFVRVASPVRGTWLASDRLDRWLSIFYNVARFAIPPGAQAISDSVFDVIAAVVKKRLSPEAFPGIEAMCPSSPLMTLLNETDADLSQRLVVIGGDCVGSGILQRLKLLITDGFFREPHDLVVPTASMFGGARRKSGVRYFFHQTPKVDHFHYFINDESLRRIRVGLLGDNAEYETMQLLKSPGTHLDLAANRAVAPDAPLVVLLPGIMGSELCTGKSDRIWVDYRDLFCGEFSRLRLDESTQEAPYPAAGGEAIYPGLPLTSATVNFYGDLLTALSKKGYAVLPAGYDWRKPLTVAASELAKQLEAAWPEQSQRPLRIIGHSMGGLVACMLFALHPRLRDRFTSSPGNRLLMLGTPNRGSMAIARTLLGDNDLVGKLAFIAPQSETDILSIANTFPGFHELLPQRGHDWADPKTWKRLFDQRKIPLDKRPAFDRGALELGRKGRAALTAALDLLPFRHICYVAGFVDPHADDATIVDIDANGAYERGPGDGTVSYASGLLENVPTWYVDAEHGNLPSTESAFAAYFDLLERGDTGRLPRDWSGYVESRRGVVLTAMAEAGKDLPEGEPKVAPLYRPSRGDVIAAILGARSRPLIGIVPSRAQPIRLRVVNGGLRFARHPVIVGHYQGDTMRGSERDLDGLFDGQLRTALDLGVYPGEVETFQVFKREQANADRRSPFAIVVGLGRPGELSVGELRRTVRRGMLAWFGTASGTPTADQSPGAFSILLLGSSVSGMTVTECARSILQGAQDAQAVLMGLPLLEGEAGPGVITELELVEIYEDKALELVHELPRIVGNQEFSEDFRLDDGIEVRTDAQRRLRDDARDIATTRRLDITVEGSRLTYTLSGLQAAVPVMTRDVDIVEIRDYVSCIIKELQTDRIFGRVLFNQLLPLELKRFALEQYEVLITLDESAASLPWELADGGGKRPLSVQSGMIRQLRSTRYTARERVTADRALVISAPRVDGLPKLAAAIAEGDVVSSVLASAGFDVVFLREATATKIRDAMGQGPYRIIHFAGHGLADYEVSPDDGLGKRTGMVIGSLPLTHPGPAASTGPVVSSARRGASDERGSNVSAHDFRWLLLTPDDIREGLAQAPELVFINCCYLGANAGIGSDAPSMARNFATSFMEIGSRAVVAAGWAIDDEAAYCFAKSFYTALAVGGLSFMEAVREARSETYNLSADGTPTWGAYQCYGDPQYTAIRAPLEEADPDFPIARSVEHWLLEQLRLAMGANGSTLRMLRSKLLQSIERVRVDDKRFLQEEPVFLAAVAACESLGAFTQARDLLDQRVAERHSMPMKARIADARVRLRIAMLEPASGMDATERKRDYLRALDRLRDLATAEDTDTGWFNLATLLRRAFLLEERASEKRKLLYAIVDATTKAWQATRESLNQRRSSHLIDKPDEDAMTDEAAQKTLSGIIIADSLGVHSKSKARPRAGLPSHGNMLRRCERKIATREAAVEFWDDVDSADLRLLILASPPGNGTSRGRSRGSRDYEVEVKGISEIYRVAIANAADAGQHDSIHAYVRFWLGLAGYFANHAAPHAREHWQRFEESLRGSDLPGLGDPADSI
jgi:Uncharacterized protein conserved in bacteria